MKAFLQQIKMFIWMTLLLGLVYPLCIAGIAHLTMKYQASGSFVTVDGKVIGSSLIAQKFTNDIYFWPRPSSIDYNPLPSGGSNLGPTSSSLKKAVEERKEIFLKGKSESDPNIIPSELLFASGSGLDPHISPSTAYFQIPRIIKSRGLKAEEGQQLLKELVEKHIQERRFGLIGEDCVNVLLLNNALDETLKQNK